MLDRFRTAVRFFVYGAIVGVLCAPASGKETRSRLMGWLAVTLRTSFRAPRNAGSGSRRFHAAARLDRPLRVRRRGGV